MIHGATGLKERLLEKMGWTVLHVPFWEWSGLGGVEEAEDKYCTELLRSHRSGSG